eukprot:CAMPEP_0184752690 /NCGR_PEP_ID=MMETSP0315-20130426/43716_1 /TAXON_ID=101924 /ORGANISM="Rhodosorus marinus, Strain UTEX LB 2760" /LENGTH=450 /DNA_ID=CAMNT_0027232041 /DNA_START=543 /DNA_END=1896 /DNA_ORIENTATION=+
MYSRTLPRRMKVRASDDDDVGEVGRYPEDNGVPYRVRKYVGRGSFGAVFEAFHQSTGETVAIKEVLQDRRFKNRELQIMKMLVHRNIIFLRESFYSADASDDGIYLNLVMDYVPETLSQAVRSYTKSKSLMPLTILKVYCFQMIRMVLRFRASSPSNPSPESALQLGVLTDGFPNHFASQDDGIYLNLVMDYVPETLSQAVRSYTKSKSLMPLTILKVYCFQMFRSLWYIHSKGICHRDVKPQNLLLNPATQELKLCDFGSAKVLVEDEANMSYICSRFYRAPELIFGATHYTTAVDVWSAGCVMAELMLGYPLFPGQSCVDLLVKIVKILGTPKDSDIDTSNGLKNAKIPVIPPESWRRVFRDYNAPDVLDLIDKLLQYNPKKRITLAEAMAHQCFDSIRSSTATLPNGDALPELFDFSIEEFRMAGPLAEKILPRDVYMELSARYGSG